MVKGIIFLLISLLISLMGVYFILSKKKETDRALKKELLKLREKWVNKKLFIEPEKFFISKTVCIGEILVRSSHFASLDGEEFYLTEGIPSDISSKKMQIMIKNITISPLCGEPGAGSRFAIIFSILSQEENTC